MKDQVVLRVVCKITIPFILLFGLYVITHGELGPGGGFQGGVIVAASFILYCLIFGKKQGSRVLPERVTECLAGFGVLLYAGTGITTMFLQGRFLDYEVLWRRGIIPETGGGLGEVIGVTLVEYGVGITVASVMIIIFNMITEPDEDSVQSEV
ncbi:MAG TPA: Na(+)/H(+) antiporter subunit B [Verrucomicrobiales bacterium]|nr:Na(+)/H(+) antiporter subunit B [Verrucomicrobiales bacterium]